MAFLDDLGNLGKRLSQAGQEAAQQAKILAETTKINSHISDEEKQINNFFIQIGKGYFETNKDNSSAEYYDLIVNIKDAQVRIAQYQEQIRQLKGKGICPSCGSVVANGALFCNSCGAKMPEQLPVTPNAPMQTSYVPVKCPQCGSDVQLNASFCDACGCNLSGVSAPSNPAPVNTNPVPAPVNTIPTPVNPIDSASVNTIPTPVNPIDSAPVNTIPTPVNPTDSAPANKGVDLSK